MLRAFLIAFTTTLAACTQPAAGPTITSPTAPFIPVFRGPSQGDGLLPGIPKAVDDLQAVGGAGEITLSFQIPKSYVTDSLAIGYKIFRKPDLGEEWDFSSRVSLDWLNELDSIPASSCGSQGGCQYVDVTGGQVKMTYAVIAYWVIDDDDSARSDPRFAAAESALRETDLDFGKGFTDRPALQVIGANVADVSREPSETVYDFRPRRLPWYLLDPEETYDQYQQVKRYARHQSIGLSSTGLDILTPDRNFYRAVLSSRGDPSLDCAGFPESQLPLCEAIIYSKPFFPYFALGQRTFRHNETFEINAMDASRKFTPHATSIQDAASGARYTFVSDDTRILVRRGSLDGCDFDEGPESTSPADRCGFQWSIGTYSPRQRCLLDDAGKVLQGGRQCSDEDLAYNMADQIAPSRHSLRRPGAPIIVGEHLYIPDTGNARVVRMPFFETQLQSCGRLLRSNDETLSRALISLPGGFTLGTRGQGADQNFTAVTILSAADSPSIDVQGDGLTAETPLHFFIELGGASLHDELVDIISELDQIELRQGVADLFTERLEVTSYVSGGDLIVGTYQAEGGRDAANSLCEFDLLLGQNGDSPDDPARFTERDCVRGGERGGRDGDQILDDLAQFVDPTGGSGRGGMACRMDVLPGSPDSPKRVPSNLRERATSDIVSDTGALSARTRYMFRAPVQIDVDESGALYVLDSGYTRADSAGGEFSATLPPRIMVWRKDPFQFERCVSTSLPGEEPSCIETGPGECQGVGCQISQCHREECAAQVFLGQPNTLAGFLHTSSQILGSNFFPDAYYPVAAFAVGKTEPTAGVWAVTGQNAKILRYEQVTQTELPVIHNDPVDRQPEDGVLYRNGVFSGVAVDDIGQKIIVSDSLTSQTVVWSGTDPRLLDENGAEDASVSTPSP